MEKPFNSCYKAARFTLLTALLVAQTLRFICGFLRGVTEHGLPAQN